MCTAGTSPYIEHGAESVRLLLDKESPACQDTTWTEAKSSGDGITVFRGIVADSDWNAVKATGVIHCPAAFLADKLQDVSEMTTFDDMTASCIVVEDVCAATKTSVRYAQAKPVFPTTARDFVVITSEKRLQDGTIAIGTRSIDHPMYPESTKFVRAHTYVSGYVIRPVDVEQCHVTLIVHMNLNGMLPAMVINVLAIDSPLKLLKRFRVLYGDKMPPRRRQSVAVQPTSSSSNATPQRPRSSSAMTHHHPINPTQAVYLSHGAESVRLLLDKVAPSPSDTTWAAVKTVDGITVYRGLVHGSEWNAVKAIGTVECDAKTLAGILQDVSEMTTFDDMTASCRVVEHVDAATKTSVRYAQAKPVFPTTARDFVVITSEKRLEDGTIAIASRSIDHPSVPVTKHFIRAHTHVSGYLIRPVSADACEVTLIVHMDLAGMIPAMVINILAVDSPVKLIKRFRDLYGRRGPLVRRHSNPMLVRQGSSSFDAPPMSAPVQHMARRDDDDDDLAHVFSASPEYMARGAESIARLLEKTSPMCPDTTWTEVKSSGDGITVFRGVVAESEWNAVKATGKIQCPAWFLAEKLQDATELLRFDDMAASCNVVELVDLASKTSVRYYQAKPVFPTTARDSVVVTSEKHLDDGRIAIASQSIAHPACPVSKSFVRTHMHVSGYVIQPLGETQCDVTFVVHLDLGGLLPAVVINVLAVDSPLKLLKRFRTLYENRPYQSVTASSSNGDDEEEHVDYHAAVKPHTHLGPHVLEHVHVADKKEYDHKSKDAHCVLCGTVPSFFHRHNCRVCGHFVCGNCSTHRIHTTGWKALRTCDKCVVELQHKGPSVSPRVLSPTRAEVAVEVPVVKASPQSPSMLTWGILSSGALLSSALWTNETTAVTLVFFVILPIAFGYLLQMEDGTEFR
ncbi:Aste57867_14200 [Aphanomyces stellatus]|uniref:Aste57867_14200 protein n=1 Tax=Aphanomyces stellatus TaxID=120398 RepID=A0A485L016_9STRA|nr:hypothetical protein As57867_014149 [Aphanomyces stellatus]VFT91025.1 Aste57867_14200 [Aphanomyces stellatus]